MNIDEYLTLAEIEDNLWHARSRLAHVERVLKRVVSPARPARVLDAGCGHGGVMLKLGQRYPNWDWSGLDSSSVACELARKRTGCDVREGSIAALPFPSASFEAVVLIDALCEVEKPETALAEVFRVLKPGGILVLNMPTRWRVGEAGGRVFRRRQAHAFLSGAGFHGVQSTHWHTLTVPEVWSWKNALSGGRRAGDLKRPAWPIQLAMRTIMAGEHAWLHAGGRWGWGAYLLAAGRKPLVEDWI